ncbi:MAG TPA: aminotransferase class V-fold PLP-dependent enzyme [Actinophytocola sp.]|uniref:pyridoxal phosphate-dependent decarboxylase family protein n=1 Tax=Actinophytocola sp. TaxID=1872138 RepID=UPI002DDC996E|nr:aminotransferase class V-fold PLP-dependent enzyme [Actinophytocola sp.]HEV2778468.1 aminotransferase class V-fold PLP-dependent enzyme [Actinophytocola sp.]
MQRNAVGARPLEPAGDELRALLAAAVDYVVGVVDRLPDEPITDSDGVAELLADPALRGAPPARGRPVTELLGVLDRAAAKGVNPGNPGLMAFVPGSGIVAAAVADLLAGVLNRYTGIAYPAPGLVALEADLLRWLADLVGLPASAAGILTTGGSMANLSAMITARHAMLGSDFARGTVYVTEQTHHSIAKALRLAGFPPAAVRVVPVDPHLRMDLAALTTMISVDRGAGRRPFCVVATAGTTNTGVVDQLAAIAHIAATQKLWLHIDAAYGGFFQLTERGRQRLRGIDRADSVILDAHKGLFLPFGTGCLLVRDGDTLRDAHSGHDPEYLRDMPKTELPDFADYGPELTRDFRGLRLWLPLHLHGVDAFRAALDEKLDLAEYVHRELSADPNLTVLAPPQLSTVTFRHRAGEEITAAVLDRVNAERRVFLSSTRVKGQYTARICVLNHRTDHTRVAEAVTAIRRHSAQVPASPNPELSTPTPPIHNPTQFDLPPRFRW